MSDQPTIKVLKKRGRKPKNKLLEIIPQKDEFIDTEKEIIITYLPININDVDTNIEKNFDNDDIFIKSETFYSDKKQNSSEEKIKKKIDILNISVESETKSTSVRNNFNKINIYNITITQDTKCWWCKHNFCTPNLSLPEQYFDNIFYCIGNFCSWECIKAYNIDTNDNCIWKRESLINLMYYLTYGNFNEIRSAPSWLTLEDFGGNLSISLFRRNFKTINNDYLVLHPPLISRQLQIEESYKKVQNNNIVVNKLDKFLFDNPTPLILKRNKPIETTQINLEKSMGLKRKT
jgi:hypothetical protein